MAWTATPATTEIPFRFTRRERYKTILRSLPYVYRHGVRKSFRSSPQAQAITRTITNPEFRRVVHDLYSAMFIRGYSQATGYAVDQSTGLAVVLFVVFMYAFDDEFERRLEDNADTSAESIIQGTAVAAIWDALGSYLQATGRNDAIRQHIMKDYFGAGFDSYRRDVPDARSNRDFGATVRLVEFDSGGVLRTVYDIIRMFNGHALHQGCAAEFHNLGMAGKFLDDMSDYTHDVRSGSPNLLDALAGETTTEFAAAHATLAAGDLLTMRWWRDHCPATFARYLDMTYGYYAKVRAPALALPLDFFLMLLGTRKFWSISTVRNSSD